MYLYIDVDLASFISGSFMGGGGWRPPQTFSALTSGIGLDDTKFH